MAVDEAVAGAVQAGADVIAADVGEALGDPRGVEHHGVLDPELALHRDAALEACGVLVGVADAQVAVAREAQPVVALELLEDALAGHAQSDVEGIDVLGLDDAHRAPRGAAGEVCALEHDDLLHAQVGERARGAEADGPRSHNGH